MGRNAEPARRFGAPGVCAAHRDEAEFCDADSIRWRSPERRQGASPMASNSFSVRMYHIPSTSAGEANVRAPMSLV